MANDWTISTSIFDYARNAWKRRIAEYWQSLNFNMWKTFNTELNPDWIDPWWEKEVGSYENLPPDDPDDPDDLTGYKICQNLYGIYCWLKYKGYHRYAMIGIMTHAIQESSASGGAWEGGYHPFRTYVDDGGSDVFSPSIYSTTLYSARWYTGSALNGTIVPPYTAYQTYQGQTIAKTSNAGDWAGVVQPSAFAINVNPDTGQVTAGNWIYSSATAYHGAGGGYGLLQWTLWTKLARLGNECAPNGSLHWQLSPTMQLLILERERYWAMNPPIGGEYLGEWVNTQAALGGFQTYPAGNRITYQAITGENSLPWARTGQVSYMNDGWVAAVNQQIESVAPDFTPADKDWLRRQTAISLWDWGFEKFHYDLSDMLARNMKTTSLYVESAIDYWETLNQDDDYILDIPHPRDIPFGSFELDSYHSEIILLMTPFGRRKRKNARTILFR